MDMNTVKQRVSRTTQEGVSDSGTPADREAGIPHPAGEVKHGRVVQGLRLMVFASWFIGCMFTIHTTQFIGVPLYFINRDYYYAWMALTKQSFGIVINTITQWFAPTIVRVSGDQSVRGQLKQTLNGRLKTNFPARMVLMANHQIYTDWLYLWWIAYTNDMHGHIFILLKESIKYVPMIGPGCMFYGFIFMARNWASDKVRIQHRLEKLKGRHAGPMSGTPGLDPMWLLIYPEGTNLSANTRKFSVKWAEKNGIPDLKHQVLPRSTGLLFCLQQLKGTVDWVYDCTVAYEGTPKGGYAAEYFTLRSTYFQGRPPKSVNMYWRRFAVSEMPLDDAKAFDVWVNAQWREKDRILEYFYDNGRFPADEGIEPSQEVKGENIKGAGFIETEVKLGSYLEIGQIFVVLATAALIANILTKLWERTVHGVLGM